MLRLNDELYANYTILCMSVTDNENVQNIALKSPQFAFGQLKTKTKLKLGLRYLLQTQKIYLRSFLSFIRLMIFQIISYLHLILMIKDVCKKTIVDSGGHPFLRQ